MPIYEYRCQGCHHDFEEITGVNDPAPACPLCANPKTEKLVSVCCHKSGGADGGGWADSGAASGAASGGGGCAGCSGGNCASCH